MARHPDWFERLDEIIEVVREACGVEWLGRSEIGAIFQCSERESIRLLHRFGAKERDNALSLTRAALSAQLEAIRRGATYAAFLRQRHEVARQLTAARAEASARQFRVRPLPPEEHRARLEDLPETLTWRRAEADTPGRFAIQYKDGSDLMRQLADFLLAASANRDEFFAGTEPPDAASR